MKRLYLTMSDEVFMYLEEDSKKANMSMSMYTVSLLEKIYIKEQFDYSNALKILTEQASAFSKCEFTLFDLPYFQEIPLFIDNQGKQKPSGIRLRLGRMFNDAVDSGQVPNVERAKTISRKTGVEVLKFKNRAAVYKIKE